MLNNQEEFLVDSELLSEKEHWVYDNCRDGIDNKNLPKELFENVSFEKGYCLRYYYNKEYKKYYPIEDIENFKYPYLTNLGIKNVYKIGTIIEKCNNNSILNKLFGPCEVEEEIQKYLQKNSGILINILTNEIRPGVYNQQIYNFFYTISNSLKKNMIIENKLYFTPLLTVFRDGIIFNKKKEEQTYSYTDSGTDINDRNEKSKIVSVYNFYLSQSGFIFKSSFKTLYDSFHQIGGVSQLLYYFFFGINYVFNKYNVINDTKKLFFLLHNDEKKNGNLQIRNFSNMVHSIRRAHFLEKSATEKGKNIMHIKKKFNKVYKNNIKINLADNNNVILSNKNYDIDNSKNLSMSPFESDKNMRISIYNKKNSLKDIDIIKEQMSINNKINIKKKSEVKSKEYKEKRIPHKSFNANAFPFDIMNKNEDKNIFKFKAY
jgi:hypothetical protein